MEPLPRAAPPVLTPRAPRWRRLRARLPIGVGGATVTAVVFAQAPGRLVADTKLDLVLDPVGLLGRGLHLWDPAAAFGHVPNQAAGYLFPMGPFFALARALAVPGWVVQRLWVSLVLVVALVGIVRLARALAIGTDSTRVMAGVAYALAPGAAALAGTSAHLLPVALLPWTISPLIRSAGRERHAAARSGIAVACMGGVNAAAVAAVLPAPLLFIVTRRRRRARLLGWWAVAVALATAWWVWALWFQARYGFDFLPFTESAEVTTAATSATEVLRGGGSWLAFLNVNGPWAQGAWTTAALPAAVLGSSLLAAVGLAGLARSDCPERRFLVGTLVLGFGFMAIGYAGPLGSPVAEPVRGLLDGPLGPLRNVGKAFPLVRLPVVLGLAHVLGVFASRWPARIGPGSRANPSRRGSAPWPGALVAAGALAVAAALVATAAPFARGELFPDGSFEEVPAHWREAAAWLDEHSPGAGRALLVPAAPFGEYAWGRPLDEPLQPVAGSPWAVRDLIPLGSAGEIRALDAVESAFAAGIGAPGLAGALARMGVSHLVVRNDLDWRRSEAPRPLQMRRVLADSPGIDRVARFGPLVGAFDVGPGGDIELRRLERQLRAVEVYAVEPAGRPVSVLPSQPVLIAGGSDALVALAGSDVVDGRAAALVGDALAPSGPAAAAVVTDTVVRRDVDFGLVRRNASYVLAPGERSPDTGDVPAEYPAPQASRSHLSVKGGRVATSSYGTFIFRLPQYGPAAAFDGRPSTAWVSGAGDDYAGEWIEFRFDDQRTVAEVAILPLADGPFRPTVREVAVTTEGGTIRSPLPAGESRVVVPAPAVPTRLVRVTLSVVDDRLDASSTAGAGLREVEIPGATYERALVVPSVAAATGARRVFAFSSPVDRSALLLGELADEEPVMRRRLRIERAGEFTLSGEAVVVPGARRDRLLEGPERTPRGDDPTVTIACEEGLEILIDGAPIAAELRGRRSDVEAFRPIAMRPCGGEVTLERGGHELEAVHDPDISVTQLTLAEAAPFGPPAPTREVGVLRWSRSRRAVHLGPGSAAILVVHENFNPGWRAMSGGRELAAVRVDGWQQGWLVPAGGAAQVRLEFPADHTYRAGLLVAGAVALMLVPLAAIGRRRRRRRPPPRSVLGAEGARKPATSAPKTGEARPAVALVAMALAGALAAAGAGAHPGSGSGTFSGWAQGAALIALAAAVAPGISGRIARHAVRRPRREVESVNPRPVRRGAVPSRTGHVSCDPAPGPSPANRDSEDGGRA